VFLVRSGLFIERIPLSWVFGDRLLYITGCRLRLSHPWGLGQGLCVGFVASFAVRTLISATCVLMLSPPYNLETLWLEITPRLGSGLWFGMPYLGLEVFLYPEQLYRPPFVGVRVRDYVCGSMTDRYWSGSRNVYVPCHVSKHRALGIRTRDTELHLVDTLCTMTGVGCRFLGLGSGTMFTVRG